MSDEMGEMWAELKQFRDEKKLRNKEFSTNFLKTFGKEHGIEFESKNNGSHLIIKYGNEIFDFWPSTGKYKNRKNSEYKRGLKNLINDINPEEPKNENN